MRLAIFLFGACVVLGFNLSHGRWEKNNGVEDSGIHGIEPEFFGYAMETPDVGGSILNWEMAGGKRWDLRILIARGVSARDSLDSMGTSTKSTNIMALTMNPANGTTLGNDSICLKIFGDLTEDAERFERSRGSGQCGALSSGCRQALEDVSSSTFQCSDFIFPESCGGKGTAVDESVHRISGVDRTSQLQGFGDFFTYFSEPTADFETLENDFRALSRMTFPVLVRTSSSSPDNPPGEVSTYVDAFCLTAARSDDDRVASNADGGNNEQEGEGEEGGGSGATPRASNAIRVTLFGAAVAAMGCAYL